MNILQALTDDNLLKPYLLSGKESLRTWAAWRDVLACLYGLPVKQKALVEQCTGRSVEKLPREGFREGLFLTGRRSGKSRISAGVAAYEAAIGGRHERLDAGEIGRVPIVCISLKQAKNVHNYVKAAFELSPLLRDMIVEEQKGCFLLSNNVQIEIMVGEGQKVRGYTSLCAIVDEICHFGTDSDNKVKTDIGLIQALRPTLLSTQGKMLAISSPHGKFGWAYKTYERCFGNDSANTLVWQAPTRTMNSTVPQEDIDIAMQEDPAAGRAEYLAEFRDDVAAFVSRDTVLANVKAGRTRALLPQAGETYTAFVDMSGGRNDDAAIAICHREHSKVIIDCLLRYKPPFAPRDVIRQMAEVIAKYKCRNVYGDNYSGEFTPSAFRDFRVRYEPAKKNKSELYIDFLQMLRGEEVVMPDDEALIHQLTRLERKTRSGGRDIVDHPRSEHDDLANVVAGAVVHAAHKFTVSVGGF